MNDETMAELVLHRFQETWGQIAADFWENNTMRLFTRGWGREDFILKWVEEQTRTYLDHQNNNFFSDWLNEVMGRGATRGES